ncbi:MAG: hypothetical protein HYZ25_18630 [Chloroflexi bacterium]|nr:hypothetical protein [Chloroflexota bacterium]
MPTPAADEKLTTVMIYSHNMLVRGDVLTKQSMRVSIWLRTQGVPNYVHLFKPQVLVLGGPAPRTLTYEEMFFPTPQVVGFHIAPPAADPVDYDASEAGRRLVDVSLMIGSFMLKARARISSQTDFATSIDVARAAWMSIYEAEISHPALPQMGVMHVPMLLVRPEQVSFAL